jgi:hypothetical protein
MEAAESSYIFCVAMVVSTNAGLGKIVVQSCKRPDGILQAGLERERMGSSSQKANIF